MVVLLTFSKRQCVFSFEQFLETEMNCRYGKLTFFEIIDTRISFYSRNTPL